MTGWLIVLCAITANALAGVFMKMLVTRTPVEMSQPGVIAMLQNPFLYLAVTGYVAALVLFTLALSRLDLSIAYTSITAGAIVLVAVLSALFFHEPLTPLKLIAIALILSGVFLLYRKA